MKQILLPALYAALLTLSLPNTACAFKGEITFTGEEKAAHRRAFPAAEPY
jgi:hypothetical protein